LRPGGLTGSTPVRVDGPEHRADAERVALAVGMDLMDVGDARASLARYGTLYLRRVFTKGEIADSKDGRDARWLAACFAAKEATLKSIGATSEPIDLRFVEIRPDASGELAVRLSGTCVEIAERAGIVRISVSVAVTHEVVAAIAVAQTTDDERE